MFRQSSGRYGEGFGRLLLLTAAMFGLAGTPLLSGTEPGLKLEIIAEKEITRVLGDKTTVEKVPANESTTGDILVYTVKYANLSDAPINSACIVDPIPTSTLFLEALPNSASIAAEISVDGGHVFAVPPIIAPASGNNGPTEIPPSYYTHVRWSFSKPLAKGAEGMFQFKVRVK